MKAIATVCGRAVFALVAALVLHASVPASVPAQDPQPPPEDPQNYDPTYDPRTDPNSPHFDPSYTAAEDPNHPLRQEQDPGPEWDAAGFSDRRNDASPHVTNLVGDWEWGELYYERSYATRLVVTNDCKSSEVVTISVNNLPYLEIPERVMVPAESEREVEATIVTPPEPTIILTGFEEIPEEGFFVDIAELNGTVVLWHPWNPEGEGCMPKRETYSVSGHIHFELPSRGSDGPRQIASPDPCEVWWNTGSRPPNLARGESGLRERGPGASAESAPDPDDCTEKMRVMAVHYRERILQSYAKEAPDDWAWLPSRSEIDAMSVGELLEMKARADALIQSEG